MAKLNLASIRFSGCNYSFEAISGCKNGLWVVALGKKILPYS